LKRGLPIFPKFDPTDKTSDKFVKLRQARNTVVQLIPQIDSQTSDTQSALDKLKYQQNAASEYVSNASEYLTEETLPADRKLEIENTIRARQSELETLRQNITDTTNKLDQSKKDQVYLRNLLNRIDEQVTELMIPESEQSSYKTEISLFFTVIMGLLIVLFFMISFWDEKVRQAIFSGQAGIQFVTLFSLVIAIILFGIVGILEAKELSALLGGISGYILGRTTTSERGTSQSTEPQIPPQMNEIESIAISFNTPNLISDGNNSFTKFIPNENIEIRGGARNNNRYTISSVSANQMTLTGNPVVDEAVGHRVQIRAI
jgi:hypothetical protein